MGGASREGKLVQAKRAYKSSPRHALFRPPLSRSAHKPPRRAVPQVRPGRHVAASSLILGAALRILLVAVVSIVAGGMVYVILPVPSAAAPGLPSAQPAPTAPLLAAPQATPGFIGGMLDGDDLVANPSGVSTTSASVGPDGPLIGWPVTDHTPSTGFGYRSDPFTHRQRWHDGVDLGQPCGDAVQASLDGTVAYTGWAGGYGNRIIVRHADRGGRTFATTYNHLSRIDVTVGRVVKQGEVIARIGSTGRSTACHLHFEVILGGSYVDPMRFLTGDQSKAALSRRVGSYMPSGLPSPSQTTTAPTHRPTATPTPTPTATATRKPTPSPTPTPTGPGSGSPTPTPTPTTPTPQPTTATPAPTTPTPTPTPTPKPTPTAAVTATPTVTHSPSPSATATSAAGRSASPTATP
jgi:hypothetical protein